jgi:hypothetical protein
MSTKGKDWARAAIAMLRGWPVTFAACALCVGLSWLWHGRAYECWAALNLGPAWPDFVQRAPLSAFVSKDVLMAMQFIVFGGIFLASVEAQAGSRIALGLLVALASLCGAVEYSSGLAHLGPACVILGLGCADFVLRGRAAGNDASEDKPESESFLGRGCALSSTLVAQALLVFGQAPNAGPFAGSLFSLKALVAIGVGVGFGVLASLSSARLLLLTGLMASALGLGAAAAAPRERITYTGSLDETLACQYGAAHLSERLAACEMRVAFSKDRAAALSWRADARVEAGDEARALADYDAAIASATEKGGPYIGRGRIFLDKGDNAAALADFEKAEALSPHLAEAALWSFLAARRLGMPGALEEALPRVAPSHWPAPLIAYFLGRMDVTQLERERDKGLSASGNRCLDGLMRGAIAQLDGDRAKAKELLSMAAGACNARRDKYAAEHALETLR